MEVRNQRFLKNDRRMMKMLEDAARKIKEAAVERRKREELLAREAQRPVKSYHEASGWEPVAKPDAFVGAPQLSPAYVAAEMGVSEAFTGYHMSKSNKAARDQLVGKPGVGGRKGGPKA
jgi:hypothetical protein